MRCAAHARHSLTMHSVSAIWMCLCVCVLHAAADPASFITPCHERDNKCHQSSAQHAVSFFSGGLPELGISVMDPMSMDKVRASQAGLDMDFRNTLVKGLRNCQVLSLSRHGHKTNMEMKCSVTLVGDYTLGGKLLVLPIEGNGKYKIKIRDIVVKIAMETGVREAGGEKYWTVNKWKHSAHVETGAEFHFQNLFNGDKQLSDTVHQFANSNWKDIFQEVAPPIVKAIVTKIVDECGKFFSKVPLKYLVLD